MEIILVLYIKVENYIDVFTKSMNHDGFRLLANILVVKFYNIVLKL